MFKQCLKKIKHPYIEFYWDGKFYRWGLYYRDPKKYISFHHVNLLTSSMSKKERIKDFFYYGIYANLKYWKIVCLNLVRNIQRRLRRK